jgi:hypothetical protein
LNHEGHEGREERELAADERGVSGAGDEMIASAVAQSQPKLAA